MDNHVEEVQRLDQSAPAPSLGLAGNGQDAAANVSFNLPAQAAALLQQAFASLQGLNNPQQMEPKVVVEEKKGKSTAVPIKEMSKATAFVEIPESYSKAETKEGDGKPPYCYRCRTKGHTMYECKKRSFVRYALAKTM